MRVTLIVNPGAGGGEGERDLMIQRLAQRGDRVNYVSSVANDLRETLRDPGDLVVVAGGDGTVAKVARELIGRDTPILIVPAGTANNIATSLGIANKELDLEKVRSTWRKKAIDVALTDGEIIIEAVGCGAISELIRLHSTDVRQGIHREAKNLGEYLEHLPAFDYRITVDGREIAGQAFLIDVMVISHVGPNLLLAPGADPGDGVLDLVIAEEKDREPLKRYLASGGREHHPQLPTTRGRSFTIACQAPWHFDDEVKPRGTRTISVRPAAWQALVP